MTIYLLDANVFIQAKNLHYGLDFCPAFWDWLVAQNLEGRVASIEKVADELHAGEDNLADWAETRGVSGFSEFVIRFGAERREEAGELPEHRFGVQVTGRW